MAQGNQIAALFSRLNARNTRGGVQITFGQAADR